MEIFLSAPVANVWNRMEPQSLGALAVPEADLPRAVI